ncbi:MAG: DMT family transporter [Paracoccaceae bacterium]
MVEQPASKSAGTGTLASVAFIGLFWGLNWPAVKFLLTEVGPFTVRAAALSLAAIVLGAYVMMRGGRLRPPLAEIPWMALTGLLSIFGFNVLVALGQVLTETSKAAIIAYTMPALTAIFAVLLLGESMTARRVLALIVAMTGIAVLAGENISALLEAPLGPGIMLAAAVTWALGTVAMKAGNFTLEPLPLTVWFLGFSGLACWPFVAVFEGVPQAPSLPILAVWLWHALLPMVLCYALWTGLVGRLPASVAAIATLMAPIVGVTSSVLLLGDPVSWQKVAALTLILASIVLTFSPAPRRRMS